MWGASLRLTARLPRRSDRRMGFALVYSVTCRGCDAEILQALSAGRARPAGDPIALTPHIAWGRRGAPRAARRRRASRPTCPPRRPPTGDHRTPPRRRPADHGSPTVRRELRPRPTRRPPLVQQTSLVPWRRTEPARLVRLATRCRGCPRTTCTRVRETDPPPRDRRATPARTRAPRATRRTPPPRRRRRRGGACAT